MAIKDSPTTRVKARTAKAFFNKITAPDQFAPLAEALIDAKSLKALVLFHNRDGKTIVLGRASEMIGTKLIDEWAHKTYAFMRPLTDAAVLVAVRDDGVVDGATWGANKLRCADAADWRDDLCDTHLYLAPFQTWFGMGCDGVPTRFSKAQNAKITEGSIAYVERVTHPQAKEA